MITIYWSSELKNIPDLSLELQNSRQEKFEFSKSVVIWDFFDAFCFWLFLSAEWSTQDEFFRESVWSSS